MPFCLWDDDFPSTNTESRLNISRGIMVLQWRAETLKNWLTLSSPEASGTAWGGLGHTRHPHRTDRWHRACREAVPFWVGGWSISVIKHLIQSLNIPLGSLLLQSCFPLFSHYPTPAWPPKACWLMAETLTRVKAELETRSVKTAEQTRAAKAARSSQHCTTDGNHRNTFSEIRQILGRNRY